MSFKCDLQQVCELHATWQRPKTITMVTNVVAVYGLSSWTASDRPSDKVLCIHKERELPMRENLTLLIQGI